MASRHGGTLCRASCHWRSIVQGPPPLEEPSRASSKSGHTSLSGGEGSVALASRNLGRKEKVTDLAAKFLDLRRNEGGLEAEALTTLPQLSRSPSLPPRGAGGTKAAEEHAPEEPSCSLNSPRPAEGGRR